jgi:hypothetical protein
LVTLVSLVRLVRVMSSSHLVVLALALLQPLDSLLLGLVFLLWGPMMVCLFRLHLAHLAPLQLALQQVVMPQHHTPLCLAMSFPAGLGAALLTCPQQEHRATSVWV